MEQPPAPTQLGSTAVICSARDFATERRGPFGEPAGGRCQRLTDLSRNHNYWRPPMVPSCSWSPEEEPFLSRLELEDTEAKAASRGEDNDTV